MLERATENGTPMLEGADRTRAGEIRGLPLWRTAYLGLAVGESQYCRT